MGGAVGRGDTLQLLNSNQLLVKSRVVKKVFKSNINTNPKKVLENIRYKIRPDLSASTNLKIIDIDFQ